MHLQADMEDDCSAATAFRYRVLWMQLSSLACETGNSCHLSLGTNLLQLFWFSVAGLYGCLTCVVNSVYDEIFINFFMALLWHAAPLYLLCNVGHQTSLHVSIYKITNY